MLNPDYRDILSAFAGAEVEYLLVGAYALAAHGYPRATGDIDLWVRPTEENAARVMRALRQFGAPPVRRSADGRIRERLRPPGRGVPGRRHPTPHRRHHFGGCGGVRRGMAGADRNQKGVPVPVIGRAHLIQNKRATGRAKDEVDAEHLEAQREDDE